MHHFVSMVTINNCTYEFAVVTKRISLQPGDLIETPDTFADKKRALAFYLTYDQFPNGILSSLKSKMRSPHSHVAYYQVRQLKDKTLVLISINPADDVVLELSDDYMTKGLLTHINTLTRQECEAHLVPLPDK